MTDVRVYYIQYNVLHKLGNSHLNNHEIDICLYPLPINGDICGGAIRRDASPFKQPARRNVS